MKIALNAIIFSGALAGALCQAADKKAIPLEVVCPAKAKVFDLCELRVTFPAELQAFATMDNTQIHDAYDADRDGVYVRLSAQFRHTAGRTVTVAGFAMKGRSGGPWQWRIRWAPYLAGEWTVMLCLKGKPAPDARPTLYIQNLKEPIAARAGKGIRGPLVAPKGEQHPAYLRRLRPDGSSEATWLFGACRAWVVRNQDKNSEWYLHEWIDREKELFAPMRAAGFNLLNQWMAPWEFLLVHHDRAEFWRQPDGRWKRLPLDKTGRWKPYQCYDQGRARAFDALVKQCEGGPQKPTIRMLLSPLPHQCLQVKEHPWGGQESGWSPKNDAGAQTLERLNGFSGFRKNMAVWDFFKADPARPLNDWRSQLFDHQANFFRYITARWGYSRAIGVWVLIDELDAVGGVVGVMSERTGWWGHPQCGRWLANMIRMFRAQLVRSDGLRYQGDPFRHPLHAATTSHGGGAVRGGNLDWAGGPRDARPDIFGWHWCPSLWAAYTWSGSWMQTIDGVASYSKAPIGSVPRLISESGAPDRYTATDPPSKLYPTLYHHAIWAAILSGQAGTPMDWDDGKHFGELRWRERRGIFDRKAYPIDHAAQLSALRRFLNDLNPETLAPCSAKGARVECTGDPILRLYALYSIKRPDAVYGWLYSPAGTPKFTVRGLAPGAYKLNWYDAWTGRPATKARNVTVTKTRPLAVNAAPILARLRAAAKPFPAETRLAKGQDVAFKLTWSGPPAKSGSRAPALSTTGDGSTAAATKYGRGYQGTSTRETDLPRMPTTIRRDPSALVSRRTARSNGPAARAPSLTTFHSPCDCIQNASEEPSGLKTNPRMSVAPGCFVSRAASLTMSQSPAEVAANTIDRLSGLNTSPPTR